MRHLGFAALLLTLPSAAHALSQGKHAKLSQSACESAGLPERFCRAVGAAAYNVDAYEFNDLSAHAQIDGPSTCASATNSLARQFKLGRFIRTGLGHIASLATSDEWAGNRDPDRVASALGKALHTIQDNCAHHGMPNPQHAWLSRSDLCDGTEWSPDVLPPSIECAEIETESILSAFRGALDRAGIDPSALDKIDSYPRQLLDRKAGCDFLDSAHRWDGVDRGWKNSIMTSALRQQLLAAISDPQAQLITICGESEDADAQLSFHRKSWDMNVAKGPSNCFPIIYYCAGDKGDGADAPPPWEDEQPTASSAAGCALRGRAPASDGATLVAFALLIAFRRSRRTESSLNRRTP